MPTFIEVIIGLTFIYVLMSLACSALLELVETVLRFRAKDLEKGVRRLLFAEESPGAEPAADFLVKRLYEQGLIRGFYQGAYVPGARNLPSYIPSWAFARAVADLCRDQNVWNAMPAELQKTLSSLGAGVGAKDFGVELERWFDSAMDRVTGWYKRRTKRILLGVGLVLAAALNMDTLSMVNTLATNHAVRDSLVAAATEYAKESKGKLPPAGATCPKESADPSCAFKAAVVEIQSLGLPRPWSDVKGDGLTAAAWATRVLGWLLTALAISLGAPFWFDALNKLVSVRAAVKPQAQAQEKAG